MGEGRSSINLNRKHKLIQHVVCSKLLSWLVSLLLNVFLKIPKISSRGIVCWSRKNISPAALHFSINFCAQQYTSIKSYKIIFYSTRCFLVSELQDLSGVKRLMTKCVSAFSFFLLKFFKINPQDKWYITFPDLLYVSLCYCKLWTMCSCFWCLWAKAEKSLWVMNCAGVFLICGPLDEN